MILRTELDARRRGLHELHRRLELVTQGALDPGVVLNDVELFQIEARFAALGKASDEFKAWCCGSLARCAAGAHASLRKADETPQTHVTSNDGRGDGSNPRIALSLRSEVWTKHWTTHDSCRRADQLAAASKQA